MGRASTRTLLPLDTWAAILGIEPRHFNGLEVVLSPTKPCHSVYLQYAWQGADQVSREDIAQAIAQAEDDVVAFLGFYPAPIWVAGEVHRTLRPLDRGTVGGDMLYDVRYAYQSVRAMFGHVISGGIEAFGLPETVHRPADWDFDDLDGDGYEETAVISIAGVTFTDPNEVAVFFAGHDHEPGWEIRPLRYVDITAGTLTIHIDRYLLVDPDLWEGIGTTRAIDGDDEDNFVDELEVYRHYNDPSQQCQLQWERRPGGCDCGATTCAMCAWSVQWACLQTRDPRLGFATYQPASWDADSEGFTAEALGVGRQPERVRLWYRAGYQSPRTKRPMVEMDPLLARLIAYYSVSLLERNLCSCDNVQSFVERWREDLALVGDHRYQLSERTLGCPWGTRAGAVEAWRRLKNYIIGKGVSY